MNPVPDEPAQLYTCDGQQYERIGTALGEEQYQGDIIEVYMDARKQLRFMETSEFFSKMVKLETTG